MLNPLKLLNAGMECNPPQHELLVPIDAQSSSMVKSLLFPKVQVPDHEL